MDFGEEISMSEELLSIVVPVYNVREYLDECISSILNQTYRNLEVILVLDGPTDGSDEICRRYAEMDRRVKLVSHEKNQGLLRARISGVQAASGEYLGFVDADDYVDPELYQQMMNCKEGFDLVVSRWKREEGDKTRIRCDPLPVGAYRTEEDMGFVLEHLVSLVELGGGEYISPGIFQAVWNKLYKTSLAKKMYDNIAENIAMFEDMVFTYPYILQCKSILITDICGYHYRVRKASMSHGAFSIDRYISDIQGMYRTLEPVFMAHPRCDVLMPQLERKVAAILNRLPRKMGFCKEAQNRTLVFPFLNLLDDKHIALYGADELGQAYRRQIRRHNMCEVDLWVDEKWEYHRREGWDVSPVEELLKGTYDYVVIAAERQETADKIREELISMGLAEDRILWKSPVEIS